MQHAKDRGMRGPVDGGTLITPELAARFADVGLYVGVSRSMARETHDEFRGLPGSHRPRPSRACATRRRRASRWGLRMTVNKRNWREIGDVFDIMEAEGVKRACFLPPRTRAGERAHGCDLDAPSAAVRPTRDRTRDWFDRGGSPEIPRTTTPTALRLPGACAEPGRAEEVPQLLHGTAATPRAGIG